MGWEERDKKLAAKKAKIKKHGYGLKVKFTAEYGVQKPKEEKKDESSEGSEDAEVSTGEGEI